MHPINGFIHLEQGTLIVFNKHYVSLISASSESQQLHLLLFNSCPTRLVVQIGDDSHMLGFLFKIFALQSLATISV